MDEAFVLTLFSLNGECVRKSKFLREKKKTSTFVQNIFSYFKGFFNFFESVQ